MTDLATAAVIEQPAPRRVFTLDAIARCEARGRHSFRFVRSWYDIGFDECTICGFTGPARSRSGATPAVAVVAPEQHPAAVAEPRQPPRTRVPLTEDERADRNALIRARRAAGELPAPRRLTRSVPADVACAARRAAAAAERHAAKVAKRAARNADIRARRAAGEHPDSIALALDVHVTTVFGVLRGAGDRPTGRPPGTKDGSTAARDAEIRIRAAAGESLVAIAADLDIHPTRAGQIARRGTPVPAGATP